MSYVETETTTHNGNDSKVRRRNAANWGKTLAAFSFEVTVDEMQGTTAAMPGENKNSPTRHRFSHKNMKPDCGQVPSDLHRSWQSHTNFHDDLRCFCCSRHTGAKASLRQHFYLMMNVFFLPPDKTYLNLLNSFCVLVLWITCWKQLMSHPSNWENFTRWILVKSHTSFMTSNSRLIRACSLRPCGSNGRLNLILVGWFRHSTNRSQRSWDFCQFHPFLIKSSQTTSCRCCTCVFQSIFSCWMIKWSLTIKLP